MPPKKKKTKPTQKQKQKQSQKVVVNINALALKKPTKRVSKGLPLQQRSVTTQVRYITTPDQPRDNRLNTNMVANRRELGTIMEQTGQRVGQAVPMPVRTPQQPVGPPPINYRSYLVPNLAPRQQTMEAPDWEGLGNRLQESIRLRDNIEERIGSMTENIRERRRVSERGPAEAAFERERAERERMRFASPSDSDESGFISGQGSPPPRGRSRTKRPEVPFR